MGSLDGIADGMKLGPEFAFKDGSYSSFKSFDINYFNLPVYRAETKEAFVVDALLLVGSFVSGGTTGGLRFALSQLESD